MEFLNRSFRLGRLFDITVRVHILFFILIGYWVITDVAHWWQQLVFSAILFGIVLMHEFGHCFGARSVGGSAHDVLMWPLGGLAYAHAPMRAWPQFVTVASGPLVNVILCIVSAGILIGATGALGVVSPNPFADPGFQYMTAQWQIYVWQFYWLNLMLLCFNLLPVFPLDGGQLFRTIIWPMVGLQRATVISAQMGIAGAILLGVFGVAKGHFMLVGIALFGGMTSYQHLQAARFGYVQEDPRSYGYGPVSPSGRRGGGFWARVLGRRRRPKRTTPSVNPNRGGWEAQREEEDRLEAEVDRILKKVHDQGIQSLSYVERQTLERATRERQKRERELQQQGRL
jgi:stage IV sporulation protein FB